VRRLLVSLLALVVVVAMVVAVGRYLGADRSEAELRVVEVHGGVTISGVGEEHDAEQGETLDADDRIQTGPASRAVLSVNGGSEIRLAPEASVQVKRIDLDGVSLELEDGNLTATVRPDSGAVRVGNRGREVVATRGEFAVGVSGDVLQVDARRGDLVLSGVDVTRVEEGQQATVVDRHAEIEAVKKELLLDVAWPGDDRTRQEQTLVAGTTEPGAKVLAKGRFGTRVTRAGADGRFELEVPLEEGDNDVQLEAVDPLGRRTEVTGRLQTRDTRGPTLKGGAEYGP
jgi:hypothetical protein